MNVDIDEIYTLVSTAAVRGQNSIPMHMLPFPMRQATIDKALTAFPEHRAWWAKLKEGYDAFETTNVPPKVTIILTRPPAYEITQVGEPLPGTEPVETIQ